jgi:hypothetical protein
VAFGREGIKRGELLYLLTLIKMNHAHGEVYLIQHYVIKFKISHAVVSNNAGDNSTYMIGPLMCSRQEFGKKKLHFH